MGGALYLRERERGLSLIEVLIALLILAIVALGIAGLFSHAQLTNASGYEYAVLASEARRTLETMQALSFNDGLLVDSAGTTVDWTAARRGFTVRYSVEDFELGGWGDVFDHGTSQPQDPSTWPVTAGGGNTNVKRITIRVSSDNRFLAGRREFVVTTLKIRDPV
jgi:prepilin-type N-terminal cleavage/methylation domain-containing protein